MTDHRFTGQVAVVTGAGSGIGAATARRFAEEGARVVCVDLIEEAAGATAEAIGSAALPLACDVSDEVAVRAAVAAAADWGGGVDVLANVAGTGGSVRFDDLTPERWQRTLAVNLTGTYLMCQAALPHLEQRRGCIVNVASIAGLTGIAFAAAYAASKGGVVAFSRALALELSERGVRVRCLCPAGIDTPMVGQFRLPRGAVVPQAARRERPSLLPPEAAAGAIADLAGDEAADAPVVVVLDEVGVRPHP